MVVKPFLWDARLPSSASPKAFRMSPEGHLSKYLYTNLSETGIESSLFDHQYAWSAIAISVIYNIKGNLQ